MKMQNTDQNETCCDTAEVAKKFGMEHSKVIRTMELLIQKGDFGSTISEQREYRGAEYFVHHLSAKQFIRLIMRFQKGDTQRTIADLLEKANILAQKILSALDDFDFEEDAPDRFLYAAQDNQGNIKIGISKNPEERVKEINIGNAYPLDLIFTRRAVKDRYQDEVAAHNSCARYWLRSEWFTEDAKAFLTA